jgi:hypothetical protein
VKTRIKKLALEAGGSTYPEVGGEILEKFANLLIKDVLQEVDDANTNHCCGTTYDLGLAQAVKQKILKHLCTEYEITYRAGEKLNDF